MSPRKAWLQKTSFDMWGQGLETCDRQARITQAFRLVHPYEALSIRTRCALSQRLVNEPHVMASRVDDRYALYQDKLPPIGHYGRAALEVLVVLSGGSALYWMDAETNSEDWELGWDLGSWHKKLVSGEGITFDTNIYNTNTMSHALAGSLYYLSARTNNLGIPMSLLFAITGSALWEYVAEFQENVSLNDMIITPLGGMAIGEVGAQLGAFFDRGSKTLLNRILATVFSPPRQLHNWLDNNAPRRTDNVDDFGFTRDMHHQFSLWTSSGVSRLRDSANRDASRDADAVIEIGLNLQLVNILGYRQPGRLSRFLTDGNFAALGLEMTVRPDGVADFFLLTRAALMGYYTQDIERDAAGRSKGYSAFIGLATAFDYTLQRWPGRGDDNITIVKFPGLALDLYYVSGDLQINAAFDFYGAFALVDAFALDQYLADGNTLEGAKSVLMRRGYYYAWGFSAAPRLRIAYNGFEIGGTFNYDYFDSIEGADRFAEQVTNDFNLRDKRVMYKVWAGYTFPNPHFQLVFGYEHRSRRGELLDVVDHSQENRYTGSLKLLF